MTIKLNKKVNINLDFIKLSSKGVDDEIAYSALIGLKINDDKITVIEYIGDKYTSKLNFIKKNDVNDLEKSINIKINLNQYVDIESELNLDDFEDLIYEKTNVMNSYKSLLEKSLINLQ